MAAGDQGAAPERKGFPIWVIIGGGALIAFVLWRARGQAAQTAPPLVPAVTTDPNTGLPIDPLTGLPFQGTSTQPKTLTDWVASAEAWATGHNLNPALVSKALYDYTNENRLTQQEADILRKILTGVGYPPIVLPWNGPTGTNPTSPKGPYFTPNAWQFWGFYSGAGTQKGVPKLLPGGANIVDVLGKVGSQIRLPAANAPIFALLPGGLLPGSPGYNKTAPLQWRRIDALSAYYLLPLGTQVGTLNEWKAA